MQMKHLNNLLTEKKEDILTHQDQIANMRAELAELREGSAVGVADGCGFDEGGATVESLNKGHAL